MSVAVATAKSDQSGVYEREDLLNGCQAVAQGVCLADVDVIAAYPIRPYTEVMDALSKLIADGKFDAEYIIADSEHSQFEIVKHASSVNARAFGGSSGTGWMYGMEALVVTATDRLPPLFVVGNRALDDPGAFGVEHNDAMAVRDMGWLLCWVTTPQEALEHVLIGHGTVAAPARTAVRRMREKGQKVGYVNLRWFRPFPTVELRDCLSRFKAVGVVDRDFAHGSPDDCGILMHEVRSCLYPAKNRPAIVNFMGGLGGRDLSIADAQRMYETTQQAATKDSMDGFITWIGLRE